MQPVPVTTTTSVIYSWVNAPVIVALLFCLAGAVFISIYVLRRSRSINKDTPPE